MSCDVEGLKSAVSSHALPTATFIIILNQKNHIHFHSDVKPKHQEGFRSSTGCFFKVEATRQGPCPLFLKCSGSPTLGRSVQKSHIWYVKKPHMASEPEYHYSSAFLLAHNALLIQRYNLSSGAVTSSQELGTQNHWNRGGGSGISNLLIMHPY